MRQRVSVLAAVTLFLGGPSGLALADLMPVVTLTEKTGNYTPTLKATVGWSFTVNQTISVNGLGVYDSNQDGLVEAHPVAIWDSTGAEVAKTTVAMGITDALVDKFRFHAITPVTLKPGDYVIGSLNIINNGDNPKGPWDDMVMPADDKAKGFGINKVITFKHSLYADSSDGKLNVPNNDGPVGCGYFGPNFSVTPEPSGLTLLGVGVLSLAGYACWRWRQGFFQGGARPVRA
jgi:hypothetical protein